MSAESGFSPVPKIREEIVQAFAGYVGVQLQLRGVASDSPDVPRLFIETALITHTQLQDSSHTVPHPALEPLKATISRATAEEFAALRTQGVLQAAAKLKIMEAGLHKDPDAIAAVQVFDSMRRRGLPVSLPRILQSAIQRG